MNSMEITVILKGKVKYMQDFGFHERDFGDGMKFKCRGFINGTIVLTAPGFGEVGGDYGNGSISVPFKELGPFE